MGGHGSFEGRSEPKEPGRTVVAHSEPFPLDAEQEKSHNSYPEDA
jgi:hypothetical protein